MKIAKYWSKQRLTAQDQQRQPVELSYWGISDSSEQDAAQNAQHQLLQWAKRLQQGVSISLDYQAQMQEIREELVEDLLQPDGSRIGAITRNRYGALVLNTEQLLIADIDIPQPNLWRRFLALFGIRYPTKQAVIQSIELLQQQEPQVGLRIYETFAGLRVFITHLPMRTNTEQSNQWLTRLGADKRYQKLCELQHCYRARLTAKPWRCEMSRPPSTKYPRENRLTQQRFANWLQRYEQKNKQHSTVHLVRQLGPLPQHEVIKKLIAVHDGIAVNGIKPLA